VIDDFEETVLTASDFAEDGDVVLLSPASASFDRFLNFVQRGQLLPKDCHGLGEV
jgi:UDP-N-acetylmuramoylalanine--D-glutamate ligase